MRAEIGAHRRLRSSRRRAISSTSARVNSRQYPRNLTAPLSCALSSLFLCLSYISCIPRSSHTYPFRPRQVSRFSIRVRRRDGILRVGPPFVCCDPTVCPVLRTGNGPTRSRSDPPAAVLSSAPASGWSATLVDRGGKTEEGSQGVELCSSSLLVGPRGYCGRLSFLAGFPPVLVGKMAFTRSS